MMLEHVASRAGLSGGATHHMGMEIFPQGPVRAALLPWQTQAASYALTVICKMTFTLTPTEAAVVDPPDALNQHDEHWDDDPAKSVFSPSDMVPTKASCDVIVVGSAFAPEQKPTRMIHAQILIAEIDKAIEVWCDRAFSLDGQLREGRRILRGQLRYERAAGGPDTSNPVGIAFDAPRDIHGMRAIPNLQPLGAVVSRPGDMFPSIGFGPIAPGWPERAKKLSRLPERFPSPGWTTRPLPAGLEPSFFNVAPPDQQVKEIRSNERLILINLHPHHARLVTALPVTYPTAVVERQGGHSEMVQMRADTLWIDTDRGVCNVTWRGYVGLRAPNEPVRVRVRVTGRERASAPHLPIAAAADGSETLFGFLSGAPPLPFTPPVPGQVPAGRPRAPFSEELISAEEISVDSAEEIAGALPTTLLLPNHPSDAKQALPFQERVAGLAATLVGPPTEPPPRLDPKPPAPAPPPPPLVEPRPAPGGPIGPAIVASPWGAVSRDAPKAMTVGEAAAAASQAEKDRVSKSADPPKPPPPAIVSAAVAPSRDLPDGAAAASDAAAREAKPVEAKPAFSFRPAMELLWHNPGSLARIRRVEAWKKIITDLKPRPEEDDLDDDLPPPRRVPPKDRRELLAILSRGEPTDADGVELALRRAIEDEAGFLPPLVLVAGELEMQFDELEALKATIAAVSPHLGASEALRKSVESIQEIFKTPFVQGANSVLLDLSRRLREAFAPVQKGLPAYDLDSHVHATLVDHRHYQKRTVFGQPRLRALFSTPGARAVVPAYLPDSLGKELPGFRRMRVRMIAEVRPRSEEGDAGAAALRGLAVGRELA